ncbi:hypothetical protein [Pseudoxanthomonas koreensis]|uniref:hypothetical protein n=1 Tax=Pseudoxanthomonas koreensis TaxID=266061 RepID=UPI001391E14C|nr:hypothetical protein [Pseudoxanthomonas koreensis]KAF1694596.1 hypothetical protein CSC64_04070 [Pseudoxanthomonas koreensis]
MNAIVSTLRSRPRNWMRGALFATALTGAATLLPAPRAHAADVQVRVLVDVADLIFRSGRPYYYESGYYRPVVVEYDHWHRPVYYRYAPRPVVVYHRPAPPRHYHAPKYRVSYNDYRYDDRKHHDHHGKKGRGHDKHRGRGWDD